MFWLVREFLPSNEIPEDELQSISNREFYFFMLLIASALLALSIAFRAFSL